MAKVSRLGWAAGISGNCHGMRIGIRVNDPQILERVATHLPAGWKPARSPIVDDIYSIRVGGGSPGSHVRRYHLLYENMWKAQRTMDLDELMERFEFLIQFRVAQWAPRRVFVHAGVVAWRGRAIVLPGRSFAGKSTMVAALVRAGARYYSDEFAVFDDRGLVHPYARPLSIREGGDRPTRYLPEDLGGRSGSKPLPVGLIAVSEYQPGARWHPRRLTPGRAVHALLAHTVAARSRPGDAFRTLPRVVAQATVMKSGRGEAEQTVQAILKQVDW